MFNGHVCSKYREACFKYDPLKMVLTGMQRPLRLLQCEQLIDNSLPCYWTRVSSVFPRLYGRNATEPFWRLQTTSATNTSGLWRNIQWRIYKQIAYWHRIVSMSGSSLQTYSMSQARRTSSITLLTGLIQETSYGVEALKRYVTEDEPMLLKEK